MSSQTHSNSSCTSVFDDSTTVGQALSVIAEELGENSSETQFLKSVWTLYHLYRNGKPYIGAGEINMRMSYTGDWLAKEWEMLDSQYDNRFKCFAGAVYNSHHLLPIRALGPTVKDTEAYEAWLCNRRGQDRKRGLDRVLEGLHIMYFGQK
jgi:hypothetical protein